MTAADVVMKRIKPTITTTLKEIGATTVMVHNSTDEPMFITAKCLKEGLPELQDCIDNLSIAMDTKELTGGWYHVKIYFKDTYDYSKVK